MKKTLPLVAGLAGTLFVSGMAQAAFTGITAEVKIDTGAPDRLFVCNFFLNFDAPGDRMLSILGLIANPLTFSTNAENGFVQITIPFVGDSNTAQTLANLNSLPALAWDSYLSIGLKSGTTSTGGIEAGSPNDETAGLGLTNFIFAPWNAPGGKLLATDAVDGGGIIFVDFAGNGPSDQNIAGVGGFANQVFFAQMTIDTNRPTNDGQPHRIDLFVPSLIWATAGGVNTEEDNFGQGFLVSHVVPAPGTLALLGLAGLAGVRRRRR